MYMIEFMSHLSIVINCSIVYFTSRTYHSFVAEGEQKVCLGEGLGANCFYIGKTNKLFVDTTGLLITVIAVEHIVSFIKFIFVKYMDTGNEFLEKERTNDLLLKQHNMK